MAKTKTSNTRTAKKSSASRTSRNSSTQSPSRSRSQASTTSRSRSQSPATSRGRSQSSTTSRNRGSEVSPTSRLAEFFVDELKDIYWAEKQLVKTLPRLQKAATSEELKEAFSNHKIETEGHVERLEQAFEMLGKKAQAKKCDAMQGITEEGSSIIEDTDAGTSTRDVGLIMAGQKAEHYEIATYGGLVQIAKTLGHVDIADLLQQTLDEEKKADQLLTEIAENDINFEAANEDEENEEEDEDEEEEEDEEEQ